MSSLNNTAGSSDDDSKVKRKKNALVTKKEAKETKNIQDASIILPYDVVRAIFSYLSGRDLNYSAIVCKLWRDVANSELSTRKVFVNSGSYNDLFKDCSSSQHFSNSITNRPMIGLFFFPSKCNPSKCISNHLPPYCYHLCIRTRGLIVQNEEYEIAENLASYVLLPADPDVHIDIITADKQGSKMTSKVTRATTKHSEIIIHKKNKVSEFIQKSISRLKNVKCIIMFNANNTEFDEFSSIDLRNIAVWGGVVEKLNSHCNRTHTTFTNDLTALVISGKNVRSWSTVLEEIDNTEEMVQIKLWEMKDNLELLKHTVAFAFSCVARSSQYYEERKIVEANIFKSIFPDIPLIGCFGFGEYGCRNFKAKGYEQNYVTDGVYSREYSTTFMILSYGKKHGNRSRN